MEKKYPVLKCNEELWAEIKPVLNNLGVNDFPNELFSDNTNDYNYIVSNWGTETLDKLNIGITYYSKVHSINGLRYLVNTKEEFLSAVAKLLGKEYPIKEETEQFNGAIKYPYIKCTQRLYDRIKDILEIVGYNTIYVDKITEDANELVINYADNFGDVTNLLENCANSNNRYECSNIRDFLTAACKLKDFEVDYIDNTEDNNSENHYFGYCINKEDKTISIYENFEEGGLQAIIVEKSVVPKKKFKKKKENYVVSYDPAVGESSTVVATIPAKGNDFDKDKGSDLDIDKPMEKINIADKLKHCKKGTKLYSPLFGEVEFENVDDKIEIIVHTDEEEIYKAYFEKDGKYYIIYKDAECLLFPSKDNRDWNNFQVLKSGHHVMVSDDAHDWCLRLYVTDNKTIHFNSDDDKDEMTWKYIVPVEDFDFTAEDITINKEKSII